MYTCMVWYKICCGIVWWGFRYMYSRFWFDISIGMQCPCTQRLAWAAGEQTAGNQGNAETTAGEGDSNPGENHDHSGSGEGWENYQWYNWF